MGLQPLVCQKAMVPNNNGINFIIIALPGEVNEEDQPEPLIFTVDRHVLDGEFAIIMKSTAGMSYTYT